MPKRRVDSWRLESYRAANEVVGRCVFIRNAHLVWVAAECGNLGCSFRLILDVQVLDTYSHKQL